MKLKITPGKLITALVVVAIGVLGLYLRTGPPHDAVFTALGVKYTGIDAYYHMRLVDFMSVNFPWLPVIDPYLSYPIDHGLVGTHFFDWLIGLVVWIAGAGAASPQTVDLVGVYFPAVLGSLVVIPVYFIGRELFNRWVGLIAALLAVTIPSEFLGRSALGFTDYHVLETVLTTTAIMFLLFAFKRGRASSYSFSQWRDWRPLKSTLLYSGLAGLFLGLYNISWAGALLFVFIFLIAIVLQYLLDHSQRRDTAYLGVTSTVVFLIPLIMVATTTGSRFYVVPLVIATLVPPLLSGVSALLTARGLTRLAFPAAMLVLGGIGIGILYAASPSLFGLMVDQFSTFLQRSASESTTIESQPFFASMRPEFGFKYSPAWVNLLTGVWLNLFGIIALLIFSIWTRQLNRDKILFFVWCLVIVLVTASQRRFAYYFTINSALLSAYVSAFVFLVLRWTWTVLSTKDRVPILAQLNRLSGASVTASELAPLATRARRRNKRGKAEVSGTPGFIRVLGYGFALIPVFFMTFYPLIQMKAPPPNEGVNHPVADMVGAPAYTAPDSWYRALTWMRDNTPEPFADPAAYYQKFEPPPPGEPFPYPDTAYGVISWWDYGYWITRIGHRIPFVNPSQDAADITTTARLMLNTDSAAAGEQLRELGTPYVIIDQDMVGVKIWAIVEWAGETLEDYLGTFYVPEGDNQLRPTTFYRPRYFQTTMVRLYNFRAQAVPASRVLVLSLENVQTDQGFEVGMVTDTKEFSSFSEAEAYVAVQPAGHHEIVSDNAFQSPVTMPALEQFELVFDSGEGANPVVILNLHD